MLCLLSLFINVEYERQILENILLALLFTTQSFRPKTSDRQYLKNFFSHFVLFEI